MQQTAPQRVREVFNSVVSDQNLVYEFNLFHSSVSQKLWSSGYYYLQLQGIDINEFRVYPATSSTQSAGTLIGQDPLLDVPSYCQHLNRLLDGFFIHSRSTLDTLAHEIFVLYESQTLPPKIYIWTARDMLMNSHSQSRVGRLLDSQLGQRWFIEFEPFRNCTTHESLIAYDDIRWSYEQVPQRYKLTRRIKLPDNPQIKPFTYYRNRIATQYCESLFKRIESLVTKVYESVLHDFSRNGNVFPIPRS
jgi:hypothetical protein